MKVAFRSASRTAILASLASLAWAGAAQAQQPPPGGDREAATLEEVVVTGSLIRGTPVDAALPVEVYSQEDLEKQGAPTALEFAKNLTIAGPTTGESYYFGGVGPGIVQYNLRGIGADKTLTLLNGRRVTENASVIPGIALARTEVLKDGAAVTYGADATGGVVNFITLDRFVGYEVSAEYKYVDGSDGDWGMAAMAGWGEGDVNFLVSAEWEHRSRLNTMERDFTFDSFDPSSPNWNPAPWSTLTNLAGWLPRGTLPALPSVANEFGSPVQGIVADFTPASCTAVGGNYISTTSCSYNYIPYYNLVEENDIYRVFAQLNAQVTDNMEFHGEVAYGQIVTPKSFGSPSQPVITGPAMATGLVNQYYVPITNPHAAAFAARNNVSPFARGFTAITYRGFAHGGNPYLGEGEGFGVPSRIENQSFRVSAGLRGLLGDWAGPLGEIGYDVALTYNHSNIYSTAPDMIGFRVQEALNGFGGPNCSAVDLDPNRFGTQNPAAAGQNGCLWWNPFSTNFPDQPVRNLANPNYVAGTENPEELVRWAFDPRADDETTQSLTFDLVFNGPSGLTLPGGDVAWAAGFQARAIEQREFIESELYNGNTECPWPSNFTSVNGAGTPALPGIPVEVADPRFRGCTVDAPGPFTFFADNPPDFADLQQYSFFGELQVPILDTLNLQLAVRREEFSTVPGETVYKIAGRWNVWGPLTLRGSYGTNYQAPPIGIIPGEINNVVRSYSVAAGNWLGAQLVTAIDLKPETATAWNIGAIWQSQGFAPDHDLQIIVDYFDIETQDEIGEVITTNQIADAVFNGAGGRTTTCDPAVQPLLNRITFNAGCTVGMSAVGAFSSVQTVVGNGPGQSTNGFDIQATYFMPFWDGDLTLGLTATKITELITGPASLDGVQVTQGDDRLGKLNYSTVAFAAPEWRANFFVNYGMGQHNFRLGVNYVSAVEDERTGIQYGETGDDWIVVDFTYRIELENELSLTASVDNIFDRDPPPAQEELGYDPRLGNPLGRTFEIGVKKRF